MNEYSTRYSEAIDSMATTPSDQWRYQSTSNRQGSEDRIESELGKQLSDREQQFLQTARDVYAERLACGVSREQARKDLPLSTYTEAYWKIDLHNLLHFLGLRLERHAQLEIREFATALAGFVEFFFPNVWEAFQDYRLDAVTFSQTEQRILSHILTVEQGYQSVIDSGLTNQRERNEFLEKLKKFLHFEL